MVARRFVQHGQIFFLLIPKFHVVGFLKDWRRQSSLAEPCAAIWLVLCASLADASSPQPANRPPSRWGVVQYVDPEGQFAMIVRQGQGTRVELDGDMELRVGQHVQFNLEPMPSETEGSRARLQGCQIRKQFPRGVWLPDHIDGAVENAEAVLFGEPEQVATYDAASRHQFVAVQATVLQACILDGQTHFDMVDDASIPFDLIVAAEPESVLAASVVGKRISVCGITDTEYRPQPSRVLYTGTFDGLRGKGASLDDVRTVEGVVTALTNDELILENAEARWLIAHEQLCCSPSHHLRVRVRAQGDRLRLVSAEVMGRAATLPAAIRRTHGEVIVGLSRLERVRLHEAEVQSVMDRKDGLWAVLKKEDCEFIAKIGWAPADFEPGQLVSVAGVPLPIAEQDRRSAFRILPSGPSDLVVMPSAPRTSWWSPMLLAALTVLGGSGVCWSRWAAAKNARTLATSRAQLQASWDLVGGASVGGIGVVIVDANHHITTINAPARALLGFQADIGEEVTQLLRALVRRAKRPERMLSAMTELAHNRSSRHEFELTIAGASRQDLHVTTVPILSGAQTGEPTGRVWLFHDETEKRQLETELQRAYKSEALGTLSSSIAHDFNNSLHVVLSNLAILEQVPSTTDDGRRRLQSARNSVDRAEKVLRQLLMFTRAGEMQREVISPNDLVEHSQPLRQTFFEGNVDFHFDMAADVPNVAVDVVMLERVLLNLCVNARDAMPQGGAVTFRTLSVEEAGACWVAIDVADTGGGISPENLERVFTPYFTTKSLEQGTGLGLSSSTSIVKRHGGRLTCESVVGEGTTFRILLPADRRAAGDTESSPDWSPLRGEGTVVLLDDDRDLRFATEQLLERFGYQVIPVSSLLEACQFLEAGEGDLVLMDYGRGRESGWAGVQRLRQIAEVPIILWSGYALEENLLALPPDCRPDDLLRKPTPPEALLKRIHELLQSSSSSLPRAK